MKDETYRPPYIEFDVAHDGSNVPITFGRFETPEEVGKFFGGNLTAINHAITVARHMDVKEKIEIRREYNDLLENILPARERDLSGATLVHSEAKRKLSDA